MVIGSPYLFRPLRTLRQACCDISASHPELIPAEFDVNFNAEKCVSYDYTPLLSKTKGVHPNNGDGKFMRPGRANR